MSEPMDNKIMGGKKSAWMSHVKQTMRANKGKPLSAVLKMAAKTYKKTAKVSKKKKNRGMFGMYGGLTTSAGPGSSTAGDVGGQMGARRRRGTKKNGSKKY
jgi:enolase